MREFGKVMEHSLIPKLEFLLGGLSSTKGGKVSTKKIMILLCAKFKDSRMGFSKVDGITKIRSSLMRNQENAI